MDGWNGERWLDISNRRLSHIMILVSMNNVIYSECDNLSPFIDKNKPVFNAEYDQKYVDNNNSERDNLCADAKSLSFQTLVLLRDLDDSFRYDCNN